MHMKVPGGPCVGPDAKLTPFPVRHGVAGTVRDNVLALDFDADFETDIFKFLNGVRKEGLPPGEPSQARNQVTAHAVCRKRRTPRVDNAYGIDLDVLFFDVLPDVGKRVAAAIVFTVGNKKQHFFRMCGFTQFVEP